MPQLGENYQPSAQGKTSAGIAAAIVGAGTIASYRSSLPKPAQTGVKVPSGANMPLRSASPFTNSYTSYSAYAKTSVGVQNLENSFRMRGSTWRGGTGRIAAPLIGSVLGAVISPIINPPILQGITSIARRTGGINASEEASLRWAIRTGKVNNISEAVGYLDKFRARQKHQLGLKYPSESKEIQSGQYPFTGGQGNGIKYLVTCAYYFPGANYPGK